MAEGPPEDVNPEAAPPAEGSPAAEGIAAGEPPVPAAGEEASKSPVDNRWWVDMGSARRKTPPRTVVLDGEVVTTCPYIWVDRDFALVRGWVQGFPKKLGSVWMTRTFGLGTTADPAIVAGSTFGGTLAANDRRLIDATVTLQRESTGGPAHNDPPLINRRHFPRLAAGHHDDPAVHELVRAKSFDRAASAVWEGDATLAFGAAPNEEHTALAPVRVGTGRRFTFAYSVNDLETVADLRDGA